MGVEELQYSITFLVLLTVSVNTAVFCDTTPSRLVETYRRFSGTCSPTSKQPFAHHDDREHKIPARPQTQDTVHVTLLNL